MASKLTKIAEMGKEPNWDGYNAEPINLQSYSFAEKLLETKPNDLPEPDWGLLPDGDVSFEYYTNPKHIFTGSVSAGGLVSFAYMEDVLVFSGTIPVGRFWDFMSLFLRRN